MALNYFKIKFKKKTVKFIPIVIINFLIFYKTINFRNLHIPNYF